MSTWIVQPFLFFDFKNINLTDAIGVIISGAPILITEEDMKPCLEASAWIKEVSVPLTRHLLWTPAHWASI